MKNIKLFLKIYISFLIIAAILLIILQILGLKTRVGYLTNFKLNNFYQITNLDNTITTNYKYNFKIGYYDKIFKNSDIYGVYPDLSNLSDYIENVEMEEGGSPYGNFISSKIIEEDKIDNINYKLKIKFKIINIILVNILIIFIYFCIKNKRIKRIIDKDISNIRIFIFNRKVKEGILSCNENIINKFIINFLFSLSLTIILIFILKSFNLSDVNIYALSLIFISLCFYYISVNNIAYIEKIYNTFIYDEKGRILIYLIITVFIISLMNMFIELEEWNYFKNIKLLSWNFFIDNNLLSLIVEIMLSIILLYILIKFSNNYLAIFLGIVSVILIGYGKYQTNIPDIGHHSAHFNSVFMIHSNIPYSKNMYSILGHFALLIEPFFKIFGLNVKTYGILISILSGISALCIVITIFLLIKSSFYRILGIFTTSFIYFTIKYNYYAVIPLRIIFPSIMILYISIIGNKKNILLNLIGYLLASLSILWNAETGLVCLVSLFISNIYAFCYDLTFKDKKLYYNIFLFSIFSICSILFSYIILNICNIYLLGGEKQNIKDLLFPLLTGQVNYIEIKINKLYNYYFIVCLIFLTTFIYYIKNMKIFRNSNYIKLEYYFPSIIFCSISALGVYTYAINRTAFFNSMIIAPMISIIIPFILYKLYELLLNKKLALSKSVYNILLSIFIIGILSTVSISVNNFTNIFYPISNDFLYYMQTKNDEKNSVTYYVTEFMKEYGYNGIASFGGPFVYGYANLGWTNSLILPNESDWWNPNFGYSNAVKIFLDRKPNIFFSYKTLKIYSFYNNKNDNDYANIFNEYVQTYYTNISTKYDEFGLYLYKLKE